MANFVALVGRETEVVWQHPIATPVFSTEAVNGLGGLTDFARHRCAQMHLPLDPMVAILRDTRFWAQIAEVETADEEIRETDGIRAARMLAGGLALGPQARVVALDLFCFGVDLVLLSDFRSQPTLVRHCTQCGLEWAIVSPKRHQSSSRIGDTC